jgi:hypothetical protein
LRSSCDLSQSTVISCVVVADSLTLNDSLIEATLSVHKSDDQTAWPKARGRHYLEFFCCIFLLAAPLLRKFRLQRCHPEAAQYAIRYDRILRDGSGTISYYAYLKVPCGVSGILIMYVRYQVITMRTSSSTRVQIDGSTNAPHTFVNSYLRVRRVTQVFTNSVITKHKATYFMLQGRAAAPQALSDSGLDPH